MDQQSIQQTETIKNKVKKYIVVECPGFEQKIIVSSAVWDSIPQKEKEIFLRASGTNQTKTWETGALFEYKGSIFTIQVRRIAELGCVLAIEEGPEILTR